MSEGALVGKPLRQPPLRWLLSLFSGRQVRLSLLVLLVLTRRPSLLQIWSDYWRRWRARRLRRLPSSTGPLKIMRIADPFVRLSGEKQAFEKLYEVQLRITDSTFGSVFECRRRQDSEGLSVVVKIVRRKDHPLLNAVRDSKKDSKAPGAPMIQRYGIVVETEEFRRYMHKLLALEHENVVRYLEFFADTSSFYFVMERCPGLTLLEHLLAESAWQESSVRPLMQQIMKALSYIHGLDIVHRDVKLENLMILPPEEHSGGSVCLKLLDFGLGCELAGACGTFGTLGYMAPETFGSDRYGSGVDVFSAGVVLYILLTGRPPFQPPVNARVLEDHLQALHDGPDMSKKPLPSVTRHGCDLLDWMLLPDASGRCTASEALRHAWLQADSRAIGSWQKQEPELWSSYSSELHFLRVMGVWNGSSCSAGLSSTGGVNSLQCVEEAEGEEDEGILEELCFHLVRQMQVPVIIADPAGPDCPIVAVSGGFEALTGYRESEVVGKNCRILNQPRAHEIPSEIVELLRQSASGQRTFTGVLPNVRANGTYFDNMMHISPIDIGARKLLVGVQMEVSGCELHSDEQELLGAARKVLTAIRHWMRSRTGRSEFCRRSSPM
ncbi:unnamed protein product [Polarella glacialis]|uniref:Non-specific serine/threonine protein kinase n=1 Tax=Polarella glacialis TaxID=89957 RepID=A0A813JP53_POLGL|nr:unnamed protein product [Polarella glacialis]